MESKNIEKEIEIADLSHNLIQFFYRSANRLIQFYFFIKKRIIIIVSFIVVGFFIGFSADNYSKKYESQVIVTSNFESVDYLYNTVELINSKIKQRDKAFLKKIGVKNSEKIINIKVEPILDVYKFITQNTQNFEMIKLLSESGDTQTTIKDLVTSKNYSSHEISLITNDDKISDGVIKSVLKYLNSNTYYENIRKVTLRNIDFRLASNQQMINQIDQILIDFSDNTKNSGKSGDKLVYYNDNMQLNDIINTRNNLVVEQGTLQLEKESYDKYIKDKSTSLNILDSKSIVSKMKWIIPLIFLIFYLFVNLVSFLANKSKLENAS